MSLPPALGEGESDRVEEERATILLPTPTAYELLQDGCGIVGSGIGDLATHPNHPDGSGRDFTSIAKQGADAPRSRNGRK